MKNAQVASAVNVKSFFATLLIAASCFQLSAQTAPADVSSKVVVHHLTSFQENDLDAVMEDYTEESVIITQDASYRGLDEIRGFLTGLSTHFPKGKSELVLDKMVSEGELTYIVWHAKTPTLNVTLGSDTFIIKNGKITQQTFAGLMQFLN